MATAPTPRHSTPLRWMLGLLDVVGSQPLGARVRQCPNPGHGGDSHVSLSVSPRDGGGVRLHCFAGCAEVDILAALELGLRQLYQPPTVSPGRFAAAARLRLTFPPVAAVRHRHPAARGYRLESAHVYSPAAGTGHRVRCHRLLRWRLPSTGDKELEWETTLTSGVTGPGLLGTPQQALPLYIEQEVRAATVLHNLPGHCHQQILVVESESSVDSLLRWNAKLWATGAPGELTSWCATTWAGGAPAVNTRRLATVLGDHPYTVLMPDFDRAGLACLRTMLAAGLGPAVLLGQPGEDARDLCQRLGPEQFARAVNHAIAAARVSGEPVATVASSRLADLPVAELGRLLTNARHTAAAPVASALLPRRATIPTSPAAGPDRQATPARAATAPPAAAYQADRPIPRAQPAAASRPSPPAPLDGAGQLPTPPPPAPPAARPRSPR